MRQADGISRLYIKKEDVSMKKKAMALLMAVAMAAGMLAGCGGGTQTASGDAAGGAKTDENGAVEYYTDEDGNKYQKLFEGGVDYFKL